MRKEVLLIAVAGLLLAARPAAVGDTVVAVDVDRIFTPTGFDDNDNAQVVVDGLLPNTCYQVTNGFQQIDHVNQIITIEARATLTDGNCVEVLVPFSHTFNFRELAEGEWLVRTTDGRLQKRLSIAEASSSGPDDQLYASVDNTYVIADGSQGYAIVIEGTYTNTCMVWERTEFIHKDPLVMEILPIVRIEHRPDCENRTFPFKAVKIKLPNISEGRFLLHVRSMNGDAVNRVFTMGIAGPGGR